MCLISYIEHRCPSSDKCKFLALGKWRGKLKQEDIPTPYMRLTDTLDMVGVQLTATWSSTRQKNGNLLQTKVSNLTGAWKTGKFMPLTSRPFSINSFALSKVWFRCCTVNLREGDFNSINSSIKRWLYADLLLKPEVMVLYRPLDQEGLGLTSVKHKSLACLIRTFLELATKGAIRGKKIGVFGTRPQSPDPLPPPSVFGTNGGEFFFKYVNR